MNEFARHGQLGGICLYFKAIFDDDNSLSNGPQAARSFSTAASSLAAAYTTWIAVAPSVVVFPTPLGVFRFPVFGMLGAFLVGVGKEAQQPLVVSSFGGSKSAENG